MLSYSHSQITWRPGCNCAWLKTLVVLTQSRARPGPCSVHVGAMCAHMTYGICNRQFSARVASTCVKTSNYAPGLESVQRIGGWTGGTATFCHPAFHCPLVGHGHTICWTCTGWKTTCCHDWAWVWAKATRSRQELVVGMQGGWKHTKYFKPNVPSWNIILELPETIDETNLTATSAIHTR